MTKENNPKVDEQNKQESTTENVKKIFKENFDKAQTYIISDQSNNKNISKRSGMVTLLLAVFLGWIGIHRFYVGKMGTGVLYLFTGGCLAIGWIIDIIKIVTGNFTDKENCKINFAGN